MKQQRFTIMWLRGLVCLSGTAAILAISGDVTGQPTPAVETPSGSETPSAASGGREPETGEKKWERDPFPTNDAQWKRVLTSPQYRVLRKRGTEKAFSGKYWNTKTPGVYRCAGCYQPVFSSAAKFDSGTGWPSYWSPYSEESIETEVEAGFFVRRIEVHCSRCGGHLGHVFNDGPPPTGLRYCINSVSLIFDKELSPIPEQPKDE